MRIIIFIHGMMLQWFALWKRRVPGSNVVGVMVL